MPRLAEIVALVLVLALFVFDSPEFSFLKDTYATHS